ncbi:hypothetical protein Ddye_027173 [Dipteronia dyeriana]|uniref:Uncharacterized protein n=1 Tax=Dipteronia dyeriana TaxID=168575 RepID=A0AAD9WR47_9ROSI|nr:hypothetical protein Ddye_027173 [Dipteronia dyeriana]
MRMSTAFLLVQIAVVHPCLIKMHSCRIMPGMLLHLVFLDGEFVLSQPLYLLHRFLSSWLLCYYFSAPPPSPNCFSVSSARTAAILDSSKTGEKRFQDLLHLSICLSSLVTSFPSILEDCFTWIDKHALKFKHIISQHLLRASVN